jgi:hypothetical protein
VCLFVAAIFSLLLAYYLPFLTGQASFFYVDHSMFFEPYCRYIGERLASGEWPLWNPLPGCGQSQLAIASPGIFFPLNWLFAVLSYSSGVAWQMLFHQLLALVATIMLVRRWGWGDAAAAVAAVTVAFGGYMFALSQNFTLVSTAAWLSMSVWALFECRESGGRRRIIFTIVCALSTALMLLAGRPEIWAPGILLLLLTALSPIFSDRNKCSWKQVLLGVVPLLCGILIAMPSLLPAAQWAQLSPRTGQVIRPNPLAGSVSWSEFIGMILSSPFGSAVQVTNVLAPLMRSEPDTQIFIPSLFVGPLVLTLAVLALFDKQWRLRWITLASLVIFLLIVAGRNAFLLPLMLKSVPVLSLVRYPSKLMFFVQWLLAIMAARGVHFAIRDQNASARGWTLGVVFWSVVFGCGFGMIMVPGGSWFGFNQFVHNYVGAASTQAISALGKSAMVWSAFALVLCLCMVAINRHDKANEQGRLTGLGMWCLVAGLTSMLMVVACRYTRFAAEPVFYARPSMTADIILQEKDSIVPPRMVGLVTGAAGFGIPNSYHVPGQALQESDICQYQRQLCLDSTSMDFGLSSLTPYEGSLTKVPYIIDKVLLEPNASRPFPFKQQAVLARICQGSSCSFAVSQMVLGSGAFLPLLRSDLFRLISQVPGLNLRVYRTLDPLPFAYFIQSGIFVPTADDALRLLLAAPEGHLDLHTTVLLNHVKRRSPDQAPIPYSPIKKTKSVEELNYSPERIEMRVDAPVDGFVVVSDSYYPGWHAYVDGERSEILCANAMFKAVRVAAGKHSVVFAFEPEILGISFYLLAAGIAILALWIATTLPRIDSDFS